MHTFAQKPKAAQPVYSFQKRHVSDKTQSCDRGGPRNFFSNFSQIPLHPKAPINIQAKLVVGPTGDVYEQEADRVSERVMRMPEAQLQRTCDCAGVCPSCQKTEPVRLQKKQAAPGELEESAVPDIVEDVLSFPGKQIDIATRSFMELRFGYDFSRVRVHTDQYAAESARAVHAHAYTVGHNVVFAEGQYVPATLAGQRLLAHELTHVVQQQAAPPTSAPAQSVISTGAKAGPAVQRDTDHKHEPGFGHHPHAPDKAMVKRLDAQAKQDDKILDILVPFINVRGNEFLDQWLMQMISAKSDASVQLKPDDGSKYWIVALLGNLLWAAACFVPGAGVVEGAAKGLDLSFRAGAAARVAGATQEVAQVTGAAVGAVNQAAGMTNLGKTMYATMTAAGSLAGSGIAQRWATDPSGDPSGKDVIATILNGKRKEMGAKLKGMSVDMLAEDMVRNGYDFKRYENGRGNYLGDVEKAVWASLFPSIPFGVLDLFYKGALTSITNALEEFKQQYDKWRDSMQLCAEHYTGYMGEVPHDKEDWPEEIKSGREQPLAYCQRHRPFKPNLHFE
jgi:hypothetical protein